MPVAATSLEAYDSVALTERQLEVLDAIEGLREASDQELSELLNWTINRVTPRRGELVDMGLVTRARIVSGPSGRKISKWRLVPRQLGLPGLNPPRIRGRDA